MLVRLCVPLAALKCDGFSCVGKSLAQLLLLLTINIQGKRKIKLNSLQRKQQQPKKAQL